MAKCRLCGGNLRGNICTECGLDNSKTDAQYQMGHSSCEKEPLTHIHYERGEEQMNSKTFTTRREQRKEKGTPTFNMSDVENMMRKKPQRKGHIRRLVRFAVIIAVIWSLIGSVFSNYKDDIVGYANEMIGGNFKDLFSKNTKKVDEDTYSRISRELSEKGNTFQQDLTAGFYKVGYHIPEGTYELSLTGDHASILVHDSENNVWIYESLDDSDTKKVKDVRLYDGAIASVSGNAKISFKTKNGQLEEMEKHSDMKNPLKESVTVKNGMIAGTDFEAGVYDLVDSSGESSTVKLYISNDVSDAPTESIFFPYISSNQERLGGDKYKNVVIPSGTKIELNGVDSIEMNPSPRIESTDYMSFYENNN